ncbi:MAG: thioredoxin family protein [Planctomycetota bacterium]
MTFSMFLGLLLVSGTTVGASAQPRGSGYADADQNYTLAYKKSVEEQKPLMVVVGAEWCPACKVLKTTTIANMEQTGELDSVSVAVVDRDAEPELAKKLMKDEKMIPQIILYHKSSDGRWNRRRLTGYQPVQPVRSLLRRIRGIGRG